MKKGRLTRKLASVGLIAALLPNFAHAHHAMGNRIPGDAFEGLLSGLAHPVIGIDHFLFVIAIGVAAYYFGRRNLTAAVFIGGTLIGTIIHLYEATLPYPDLWVALTLALLGLLFFRGPALLRGKAALAFFGLSGIAHGYAYGESIVGAEPTPLAAYLIGFALVQFAVAVGAYEVTRVLSRRQLALHVAPAFGGVLLLAGAAFLFLAIV